MLCKALGCAAVGAVSIDTVPAPRFSPTLLAVSGLQLDYISSIQPLVVIAVVVVNACSIVRFVLALRPCPALQSLDELRWLGWPMLAVAPVQGALRLSRAVLA